MYKTGQGLLNSVMNMWNSNISKKKPTASKKNRSKTLLPSKMKKNRGKQPIKKRKKHKKYTFKKLISETKRSLKAVQKPKCADDVLNTALAAARHIKDTNKNISTPRVIPIPKYGGVLSLIPIFAGLSALGSLVGGLPAVVKAINSTKDARKVLNANNHLREKTGMGAIAVGKTNGGDGLYLLPYKKGYGLFLKSYPSKSKN